MKIELLVAALCIAGALGDKAKVNKADKKVTEVKPKREAPISGGGGGYHGPSHKYLPPSSSVHSGGFDSYSSGHHSVSDDISGYQIGSSALGHGHGGGHYVSSGPKVETYIVQTESAHGNYGGLHGGSDSHSGIGYKYSGASSSFGGDFGGSQSSFAGSHAHGHGPVHKIKAIVIPTQSFSAVGHGSGGYARFAGHNGGHGFSKGFSSGPHYSNHIDGGYAAHGHGSSFDGGYSSGHLSGSDFSADKGSHGFEHGNDYSSQSFEPAYRGSDYSGSRGSLGGYSYVAPSPAFTHGHGHGSPASNYAAPNILSPPYHTGSGGQHAPAYAVGHKGLGHFGFSASKPQALNTNFIDSSRYGGSYVSQGHDSHGSSHGISSAPFKPSLFLGTSHEGSSTGSAISTEYGSPAVSQGISQEYLPPPTSVGYDYPAPSTLYGAPTDDHTSANGGGAVHEPENTYLPPSAPHSSYGSPASPEESYLPPHH